MKKSPFPSSKGQSAVEIALLVPVLFLIGSVAVDLGNLLLTNYRLWAGVIEGSRFISEYGGDPPVSYSNCQVEAGANCSSGNLCCAALNTINRVLQDSSIRNANLKGNWKNKTISGEGEYSITYRLLEIEGSLVQPFLFQNANQTIKAFSVGYLGLEPEHTEGVDDD